MKAIKTRLEAVEKAAHDLEGGKFIVIYKDGSARKIEPKDSIDVIREEADTIERIEAPEPDGAENGILCALVNALIQE